MEATDPVDVVIEESIIEWALEMREQVEESREIRMQNAVARAHGA